MTMAKQARFPGWRTMTAAQRYNARMGALFEDYRARERAKKAACSFNAFGRCGCADGPCAVQEQTSD